MNFVAGCSLLAVASARIARCMQDAVQVTVILTTITLQYSESCTAAGDHNLTCLHHGCHASKPPVKCYVSHLTDSKPFVCAGLHEIWEDGQAFKDLRKRLKALSEAKANIEAARKARLKACCMLTDSARNTGCLQRNVMCTLL